MRPNDVPRFVARAAAVCGLLVLTPLTFTPGEGVQENLACSRESPNCIREIDAVCTAGSKPIMNYYTKNEV